MYLTLDWLTEAAADAVLRNSPYTTYLDILTARLHGNMSYSAARIAAESRVERCLNEMKK